MDSKFLKRARVKWSIIIRNRKVLLEPWFTVVIALLMTLLFPEMALTAVLLSCKLAAWPKIDREPSTLLVEDIRRSKHWPEKMTSSNIVTQPPL